LTALERFFIDDGAAGSDVMAHAVFELGRAMNNEVASESFHQTIARHPLLTSRVALDPAGRRCWVQVDSPCLFFSVEAFCNSLDSKGYANLEAGNGFKVLVEGFNDRTRIQIRFHHAVCDGLAVIHVFEQWMATFRDMTEGREIAQHRVDASLLLTRGWPRWRTPERVGRMAATWALLCHAARWLFTRPVRVQSGDASQCRSAVTSSLAQEGASGLSLVSKFGCESRTIALNAVQTKALKDEASRSRQSVNDVILSKLLFVLNHFVSANGHGKLQSRSIRVSVPNSLRLRKDRNMPACNVLGLGFIDHHIVLDVNQKHFAQASWQQMRELRRWNGGQAFIDGLYHAQKFVPLYRRLLRSDMCFASAIYSSVGDVSNIDRDLISLEGKSPLRRNTNVGVFAATVNGRLIVTVTMSRSSLVEEDRLLILGWLYDQLSGSTVSVMQ
jgi:hypothetical protein